jgi:hypothetical protein
MLQKKYVDNVIVQATYMSGDRNAIASALKLNQKLGILILTAPGSLDSGKELKDFYVSVSSLDRVGVVEVPDISIPGKTPLQVAYKQITARSMKDRPNWLQNAVDKSVKVQSATFGTTVIADAFSGKKKGAPGADKARDLLQNFWKLDQANKGLEEKVDAWLKEKGFLPTNRYVFLFAKQGERNAEKAHHFTSINTWNLLIDKIRQLAHGSSEVIPVAAGDRIGLRTSPDLAEFWRDTKWKEMISGVDDRRAQLGLWCYLAMQYPAVSIIGMRSGMIEVPALVGVRTLFLEEKFNAQAPRMEKWLGTVPGFERQIVDVPPGIAQGLYWKRESEKSYATPAMKSHAEDKGRHLAGNAMTMGKLQINPPGLQASRSQYDTRKMLQTSPFSSGISASEDPVQPDQETRAQYMRVMGDIPGKDIANFGLTNTEWDQILHWVSKMPTPTSDAADS